MDGKFQTSFIPKKPVVSAERSRNSGMSLFMIVSIFIFAVSLALAGLVFFGQRYLSSQLEKDKQNFSKAQENFDSITIETLVKLSKRIESAKKILNKHRAILPIFDFLETKTLENIRFKTVNVSFSEDGIPKLDIKGEAKNFSAVALQSDVFSESKELKNSIMSDVDLALTGGVTFNFTSEVDPNLALYKTVYSNDEKETETETETEAETETVETESFNSQDEQDISNL